MTYVALYHGTSLASRYIRWHSRMDTSHAAVVYADGQTLEAWQRGGVALNADPWTVHTPGTEIDFYPVPHVFDRAAADRWLAEYDIIGAGYDWPGVAGFRFRCVRQSAKRWFCSELAMVYAAAGGVELLRAESWLVAPGHLAWSTRLGHLYSASCMAEFTILAERFGV